MKHSNQFPTEVTLKNTDRTLCTLTYTYPLTGVTKAIKGCIGVKYREVNKVIDQMVGNGYVRANFHKPVYHVNHELLETIK